MHPCMQTLWRVRVQIPTDRRLDATTRRKSENGFCHADFETPACAVGGAHPPSIPDTLQGLSLLRGCWSPRRAAARARTDLAAPTLPTQVLPPRNACSNKAL